MGKLKTLSAADSNCFHVTIYAANYWIAGLISAKRGATTEIVLRVRLAAYMDATVEGRKRRKSAVREDFNVRIRVRDCWGVGSMCVKEGVIQESVDSVLFRGRGLVHVGRMCMKEWLVMLLCRFAEVHVIRC